MMWQLKANNSDKDVKEKGNPIYWSPVYMRAWLLTSI